jgi:hypothetical protein
MGFANLLESYCPSGSLAANPWDGTHPPASSLNESIVFEDYCERYVEVVQPDFLCTDYYPYFEPWNQFPFANRLNIHTEGRGVQSMDNCEKWTALRERAALSFVIMTHSIPIR